MSGKRSLFIRGGRAGDWFAIIGGNTLNANGNAIGGGGFDNGFDDGSNGGGGPFAFDVEGADPPPDLFDCIDELLGIDCFIPFV